jgi:hypothetical protein
MASSASRLGWPNTLISVILAFSMWIVSAMRSWPCGATTSWIAVYQCRPRKSCRGPGVAQRSFRDVLRTAEFGPFGGRNHPAISAPDNIGVEQ